MVPMVMPVPVIPARIVAPFDMRPAPLVASKLWLVSRANAITRCRFRVMSTGVRRPVRR